ncbi:MAG: FAD-dependent oxidoreductase [Planctomycetota bacterium]
MKDSAFDVAVIGGGPAGICAAAQAARAGAKTLLVEKTGLLGGQMTTAGVNFPAQFHARGTQVIAGIGWDLVARAIELAGDEVPEFVPDTDDRRLPRHFRINIPVFAALADECVLESGATILFHTMPAVVWAKARDWTMTLCGKEGLDDVMAKQIVDCTGDANAAQLVGCDVVRHDELQPGTIVAHGAGYRFEDLDMDAIESAAAEAIERGEVRIEDFGWSDPPARTWLRSYGGNRTHICDVDAETSEGKTEAEIEGRRALMRLYRFFRSQPGLENFRFTNVAPECGIRETVTIRGRKTITLDDYEKGKTWDDAVCYSFYPIDLHLPHGIEGRGLEAGVLPTIPRGAMLPEDIEDVIVAGRAIAGDRLANSAYRVQATCMATGQAAGAMAALAAERDCDAEALPMPDIHDLLREHGAIIPGEPEHGARGGGEPAGESAPLGR